MVKNNKNELSFCKKVGMDCKYKRYCENPVKFNGVLLENLKKINSVDFGFLLFKLFKKRKIMKREYVSIFKLKDLINRYTNEGFKVCCYTQNKKSTLYPKLYGNDTKFIILAYESNRDLKIFLDGDLDRDEKICGFLLGYPNCCIKKYLLEKNKRTHIDFRWKKELFKEEDYVCPLINKEINLFRHIPCSPICKKTIKISQVILDFVENKLGVNFVKTYFHYVKNSDMIKGKCVRCGGNMFNRLPHAKYCKSCGDLMIIGTELGYKNEK